jgi:ABC-type sugar transport system substrate-binding protein
MQKASNATRRAAAARLARVTCSGSATGRASVAPCAGSVIASDHTIGDSFRPVARYDARAAAAKRGDLLITRHYLER